MWIMETFKLFIRCDWATFDERTYHTPGEIYFYSVEFMASNGMCYDIGRYLLDR